MRPHVRRLRATHTHIAGAAARAVFEPSSVYDADVDEMADEFKSYVDTVAPPFRGTARRVSPDPEDFDTMSEEQKYFFECEPPPCPCMPHPVLPPPTRPAQSPPPCGPTC